MADLLNKLDDLNDDHASIEPDELPWDDLQGGIPAPTREQWFKLPGYIQFKIICLVTWGLWIHRARSWWQFLSCKGARRGV